MAILVIMLSDNLRMNQISSLIAQTPEVQNHSPNLDFQPVVVLQDMDTKELVSSEPRNLLENLQGVFSTLDLSQASAPSTVGRDHPQSEW